MYSTEAILYSHQLQNLYYYSETELMKNTNDLGNIIEIYTLPTGKAEVSCKTITEKNYKCEWHLKLSTGQSDRFTKKYSM